MTRRAFLGASMGTGALALPLAGVALASTRTVYGLDPSWGAADATCTPDHAHTCSGCYACVRHAENKVFASALAGDAGRAHRGCRCLVKPLYTLDDGTFNRLFTGSPAADRRSAGVTKLLTNASRPSASGVLPFTGSNVLPWVTVGAVAAGVGAALRIAARRTQVESESFFTASK
jgi:hypothetical protein